MGRPKSIEGCEITSVSASPYFMALCRKHNIKYSDAFKIGIAVKLAELGLREYPENLKIVEKAAEYKAKMNKFRDLLEQNGHKT